MAGNNALLEKKWSLEELDISGMARHGLLKPNEVIGQRDMSVDPANGYLTDGTFNFSNPPFQVTYISAKFVPTRDETIFILIRGNKQYELANHLGNVLVTVSDRKGSRQLTGSTGMQADYYLPYVLTITDYYAFGSPDDCFVFQKNNYNVVGPRISNLFYLKKRLKFRDSMKQRTTSYGSSYRYGFNNQEKDAEMGEYYAFEYRIHDARIGRFLSVDPLSNKFCFQSSYLFASNNPIFFIDFLGLKSNPGGNHKIVSQDCPFSLASRYGISMQSLAIQNEGQFQNGSFFKPKPADMSWDSYWQQGGIMWMLKPGDVIKTSNWDYSSPSNFSGYVEGSSFGSVCVDNYLKSTKIDNTEVSTQNCVTTSTSISQTSSPQITLAAYNQTFNPNPHIPGSFSYWYYENSSQYANPLEAYNAWRSYPGQHPFENSEDRLIRVAAYSAYEARKEFASGGMNMYGGVGKIFTITKIAPRAENTAAAVNRIQTVFENFESQAISCEEGLLIKGGTKPLNTQWGWTGTKAWRDLVSLVERGGTIENLSGKIPTQSEAIKLLEDAGIDMEKIRIEGPHVAPNPHVYNHINYRTPQGLPGTIRIQDL